MLLCLALAACASGQAGQRGPVASPAAQSTPLYQAPESKQGLAQTAPAVPPSPAPPPGESLSAEVITKPPALLVKDGFASPECVLHDVADDVYLVSNVNGSPGEADDNGFITRVAPDGHVESLKWIDGADEAIELHAPRGMAIVGDVLYVADLDHIRKFDLHSGAALGAIAVPGASALNGLTAAQDGALYVTDAGLRANAGGGFERTGTDAVYKLVGDRARALARGRQLDQPQGIRADGADIWVVSFGVPELYNVGSGAKSKPHALPASMLDGIVKANDGRWYISSRQNSQIFVGEPGGDFDVAYETSSPAGIGYDAKRNWLLIPVAADNAVKLQPL